MLLPYTVAIVSMLAHVNYLHIMQSIMSIHVESCIWPPDEYKFSIHSLLA